MIISNIDQFKAVMPTAAGLEDFEDLKPYLESADLWIKTHILGNDLYSKVVEMLSESGEIDQDLLNLCRNVVGNHAYWDAIPFLDVIHTNQGFGVIQNKNTAPASSQRVERLRKQCLIRRDSEVENLIEFLEEKENYHELWKVSPAFSILSDCLIRTARELEVYAEWEGTRGDFLKLRPRLIQLTASRLEPIFSKDYIGELIEKQRDGDLNADDKMVSLFLKQALGSLLTDNMVAAEAVANDAMRYIDRYPGSFQTYFESKEYAARQTPDFENSSENPIFSSIF